MKRWLFAGTASLALLAAGLVHGFWTDRWTQSNETKEAADRLPHIPLVLGDWEGKDIEVKPGQAGAGVVGCLQRSYFNRHRGATVVMALVCGRPGPVGTHTPEVCYGANGYLVGKRQARNLEAEQPAVFWTSDAVRTRVSDETRVRLYWAWNGGEGWVASPDARQQFPRYRYPVLHKLYVLRDLSGSPREASKDEPCEAFLQAALPALHKALFGGP
jgi:hypothetical protein